MSIDSFFTAQTGQAGSAGALKSGGAKAGGGAGGLAFFDLFLSNLEQALDGGLQTAKTAQQSQAADTKQTLLQALANSEYSLEELSKLEDPTIADVLGFNQQIDDERLLSIELPGTQGISSVLESILIDTEADFRPALSNLQRILQKINEMLAAENPALINTNLDAQKISDLQARVEAMLSGDTKDSEIDAEEFAGVFVGLIKILPPQARPEIVVTGQSVIISNNPLNVDGGQNLPANDGSAKLNPLLGGAGTDGEFSDETGEDFDGTKGVEALIKKMGKNGPEMKLVSANSAAENAPKTLPDLSLLQNWPYAGTLLSDIELSPALMEELGLSLSSFSGTSTGALTSLVTQGSHASAPHPGTQMIAATIQRAAGSGDTSNITLQLDPPELGRVEVKMNFDKDSKIKAVMTVEKPETMLMLQRDSHILERALQEAGLDSEGGLSFEMADQDHSFGQDGSHDGSRNASGSPEDGENELEEFIESTMTWMVDPETGHTHYSILA